MMKIALLIIFQEITKSNTLWDNDPWIVVYLYLNIAAIAASVIALIYLYILLVKYLRLKIKKMKKEI